MHFQVPQFIDIEDKIIGPLTLKQFIYLLIGGVIVFILYKMLNLFATIMISIPVVAVCLGLAFVKINNQPLINLIGNALKFLKKPDFYVWKKVPEKNKEQEKEVQIIKKEVPKIKSAPKAKESLEDIGWKVEIEK